MTDTLPKVDTTKATAPHDKIDSAVQGLESPAATKKAVKVDTTDTGTTLEKVDSAVQGLSLKDAKDAKRRASSVAEPGVMNILDLGRMIARIRDAKC